MNEQLEYVNGLPIFDVTFSDFTYIISLYKNNKRFLTKNLTDNTLINYIKNTKSRDCYIRYGDILIDFRTYKQ